MKRQVINNPTDRNSGAAWVLNVSACAKALRFVWAAERDERDGFPLTAAAEWRSAAELMSSIIPFATYSWRQWERIMRLPRRFAAPIGDDRVVVSSLVALETGAHVAPFALQAAA